MNKLFYTSLLLLTFITSNAQKDFQGMAVYESAARSISGTFESRGERRFPDGNDEVS